CLAHFRTCQWLWVRFGASAATCGQSSRSLTSSVGDVGNYAKGERRPADQNFVSVYAVDILARDDRPFDLVVVAAAADEGDVVHSGERVRDLRAVEEDGARSQVGMYANVEELLRELVPVLRNAGAAKERGLVVL